MSKPGAWKNRIVGHGEEAPDQLLANPANWRTHPGFQMEALEQVMDEVGVVSPVMVNRTTGHLVDGHARVQLAMRRDEPSVQVDYVELTESEERLVLATLDPLAMMGGADKEKLGELLAGIPADGKIADMLEDLKAHAGAGPPIVDFKEYGDDAADDVQHIECPSCGHRWPK